MYIFLEWSVEVFFLKKWTFTCLTEDNLKSIKEHREVFFHIKGPYLTWSLKNKLRIPGQDGGCGTSAGEKKTGTM